METTLWSLLCVPPLAVMAVSDFRRRTVGVVPLCIFGSAVLASAVLESGGFRGPFRNLGWNALTCVLLWGFLLGWAKLRGHRLGEMCGAGDAVFVFWLAPYFQPRQFILFLTVSSALTLLLWGLFRRLSPNRLAKLSESDRHASAESIPLVTFFGAFLIVYIICHILITI